MESHSSYRLPLTTEMRRTNKQSLVYRERQGETEKDEEQRESSRDAVVVNRERGGDECSVQRAKLPQAFGQNTLEGGLGSLTSLFSRATTHRLQVRRLR